MDSKPCPVSCNKDVATRLQPCGKLRKLRQRIDTHVPTIVTVLLVYSSPYKKGMERAVIVVIHN